MKVILRCAESYLLQVQMSIHRSLALCYHGRMCFSPSASFVVSGTLAIAGTAVLSKRVPKRELPAAAAPLFFAAQQFAEGIVWLYLYDTGPVKQLAVAVFSGFAFIFWPIYAPLTALTAEPDARRRRFMSWCFVAGLAAAGFFAATMLQHGVGVVLDQGCLQYQVAMPWYVGLLYMLGVSAALVASSLGYIRAMGIAVFLGAAAAWAAYPFALASVWCYFAAACSLMLALHFFHFAKRGKQF